VPARVLAPPNGTMARYRLQEWLNFIGTEIHKSFGILFNPAIPADAKPVVQARIGQRLTWVDAQLQGKAYLMGADFMVADAYLFTVASWAPHLGVDTAALSNLSAFQARMAARPAVQAALKAESLLK
jgi:glutathione S-transferase